MQVTWFIPQVAAGLLCPVMAGTPEVFSEVRRNPQLHQDRVLRHRVHEVTAKLLEASLESHLVPLVLQIQNWDVVSVVFRLSRNLAFCRLKTHPGSCKVSVGN